MPPARPTLTSDEVVAEAVAHADDHGLPALSIPALAARLGVEAMSLDLHVADKEALLDAMVDAVVGEIHLPLVGHDWRGQLRARSVSGRTVLTRHRWALGIMGSRRTPGRATLAHHDALIECLRRAGFGLAETSTAVALLDAHLYGFVLAETHGLRPGPGQAFGNEFEVTLDLVLDALGRLREATGRELLEVTAPVLGADACAAGWVGAVLVPGAPRPRVVVAPTIGELVEAVRREVDVRVVGIDMPIGLPDTTTRQADALARKELGARASSVFTTLTRPAYEAGTRRAADTVNRALSGQGVGAQAFALRPKILEVDAWLRSRPTVEVVEVHPEVSFVAMAGRPLPPKRTPDGHRTRLEALHGAGVASPSVLAGDGYAADDVLDACAVAWTAARRAAGLSRSLPDPPEVFSDGVPSAIHV